MLKKVLNARAVGSLLGTRMIYAINWYVIAAIFSSMASELDQNVSGLGLLTASFYLGIAAFQVPAGILAGKYSPKKAVVYGMALLSLAELLIGFTDEFYVIAILRFVVGVGMAMVFAPSVILVVRHFVRGQEGLGIGMLSVAFDIGAAAGLFGWAVLGELLGWRLGVGLSGALGLAGALALQLTLPRDEGHREFKFDTSRLLGIIFDRQLLVLNACLFGLASSTLIGGFIVYYLHNELGVPLGLAGAVGGLNMVFALLSAPIVGRLSDRVGSFKKILLVSGALGALGTAVVAFSVWGAVVGSVVGGFGFSGGLTLSFIIARERRDDPSYQIISVAWVNSASLAGAFVAPVLFTYLVVAFGYGTAWLASGIYATLLLVPILWLKDRRET